MAITNIIECYPATIFGPAVGYCHLSEDNVYTVQEARDVDMGPCPYQVIRIRTIAPLRSRIAAIAKEVAQCFYNETDDLCPSAIWRHDELYLYIPEEKYCEGIYTVLIDAIDEKIKGMKWTVVNLSANV